MARFATFLTALSLCATAFIAGQAAATPAGMTGPIQTYSSPFGSAHRSAVESYIETTYAPGSDVTFLGRLNFNGSTNSFTTESIYSGVTLTATCTNSADCKAGTWTLVPGSTGFLVSYLEISGGGGSALYDVDPNALTGVWNTNDLFAGNSENHPELSHLDFWGELSGSQCERDCEPPTNVPEPGTLSLMGAALLAGTLTRRRRKAKTA